MKNFLSSEISLGPDFITITRGGADHLWQVLKPDIFGTIEDFYASNLPVIADGASFTSTLDINDDDDETLAFIKTLLEERVRPTLFEDGGDLELISWEPITQSFRNLMFVINENLDFSLKLMKKLLFPKPSVLEF